MGRQRRAQRIGGPAHVFEPSGMLGLQRVEIAAAKDAVGPTGEDELTAAPAQDQLRRNPTRLSH